MCALVYVAHSLPMKFIDGGDPYEKRTDLTVTEVHARMSRTVREAGHADWLADAGVSADELAALDWNPKDGGTFQEILARLTVDADGNNALSPEFDRDAIAHYALTMPGTDGGGDRFVDQIDIARAGSDRRIDDGAPLDFLQGAQGLGGTAQDYARLLALWLDMTPDSQVLELVAPGQTKLIAEKNVLDGDSYATMPQYERLTDGLQFARWKHPMSGHVYERIEEDRVRLLWASAAEGQRLHIEGTRENKGAGDVVRRALGRELFEEPQPLLPHGKPEASVAGNRADRCKLALCLPLRVSEQASQVGYSRCLEHNSDADGDPQ